MTEREGRLKLQFQNGTYLKIGEESQVDIIALSSDQENGFFHLNQWRGESM